MNNNIELKQIFLPNSSQPESPQPSLAHRNINANKVYSMRSALLTQIIIHSHIMLALFTVSLTAEEAQAQTHSTRLSSQIGVVLISLVVSLHIQQYISSDKETRSLLKYLQSRLLTLLLVGPLLLLVFEIQLMTAFLTIWGAIWMVCNLSWSTYDTQIFMGFFSYILALFMGINAEFMDNGPLFARVTLVYAVFALSGQLSAIIWAVEVALNLKCIRISIIMVVLMILAILSFNSLWVVYCFRCQFKLSMDIFSYVIAIIHLWAIMVLLLYNKRIALVLKYFHHLSRVLFRLTQNSFSLDHKISCRDIKWEEQLCNICCKRVVVQVSMHSRCMHMLTCISCYQKWGHQSTFVCPICKRRITLESTVDPLAKLEQVPAQYQQLLRHNEYLITVEEEEDDW